VTDDGKLQGLNFRPDGDGGPGAVVACAEEDKLGSSPAGVPIRMNLAGLYRVISPVLTSTFDVLNVYC
jgi:hypothetical protein